MDMHRPLHLVDRGQGKASGHLYPYKLFLAARICLKQNGGAGGWEQSWWQPSDPQKGEE